MTLLAVPNVSEGRSPVRIRGMADAVTATGARVLDIHSDTVHHRSVLTVTGPTANLEAAMVALCEACSFIDLTLHEGVHPRLGGLDVCPFVPLEVTMEEAVVSAHSVGRLIHDHTGLPVYFYGKAATRESTRSLPDLRRGGLSNLKQRADKDLPPDLGDGIDERRGVVCVGARGVLIAFNVVLETGIEVARRVASEVRASGGGPTGVRALALPLESGRVQVSMNLTEPDQTSIDYAFGEVARVARSEGASIVATEIVGLVPERFLPKGEAARLLLRPSRSLESVLS
jgi:glutamate formiminotransferase / 5-formyltetrahydrofolate cyclo-ligase